MPTTDKNFKAEYDAEFARDTSINEDELTPEQQRMRGDMALVAELVAERERAIRDKQQEVEPRLIASARMYRGDSKDDAGRTLEEQFRGKAVGSRVYHNITRQITNDGASQLGDLLFPSDDKNYGLNPVPLEAPPLDSINEQAVNSKGEPLTDAEGQPLTNMQAHNRRVERAAAKTKRMFTKLDSSLIASRYPKKARQCIFDGAMYGTGILKGPVPNLAPSVWAKKKGGKYALKNTDELRPDIKRVSPLDFFPDMSAASPEEWGFTWERAYLLPADLQDVAKERGFDAGVVSDLLLIGPSSVSSSEDQARESVKESSGQSSLSQSRFVLWERHGVVRRNKLSESITAGIPESIEWVRCIIYMINDRMLKVVVSPYENTSSVYSVFNWDEDPMCVFGYGVPTLMEHPQRVYVAAWCMALDNAGVATLPQIVVDKLGIKPADGTNDYSIYGGKVWEKTGELYSREGSSKPFELFPIGQDIQQLFALMDKAESDAYELTGVTRVEKSQQVNDNAPVTLGATQIMQNNSSVSRRAQARRYDDQITATLIQRFYDYFMQFEVDEDLKGRMEVEPRGSTILLSKELQANNLLQFYQLTSGGTAEGVKGLQLLRAISTSMQHPEGQFLSTDEEMQVAAEAAAQQGQEQDPMLVLEERKVAVSEAEIELRQSELRLLAEEKQARFQLDAEKVSKDLELRWAKLDQEERKALGQSQHQFARLDVDMQRASLSESTKRDSVAAKIQADRAKAADASSKAAVELSLRQQDADRKDVELHNKMTTGQSGI